MTIYEDHSKVAAGLFGAVSIILALGVIALILLISTPARAQVVGATLSGTLSDPSGSVITKAQVVIKNVATGISTTVTANASGFYTAPNLIPGSYEMTATAFGFSTEVRTGITLEVGAQLVENVTLKVGQETQKVEITADAPEIQLASSSIGAVVGSQAVVDLPLNGRSWTDLATLQPGAIGLTTQSPLTSLGNAAGRSFKGFAAQDSIDGARPPMNNYRLDGVSINDYSNAAPSNVIGETAGVDSIQEFSVLTHDYSAEYGDTAGGVINAITRSGTNTFHGSAYEFLRNSALDARNYFNGPTIPAFRRNQFGGSIGGPIRKEHTFFFATYEGLRQLQGITIDNVVPSPAARAGNLCSIPGTPATCTPTTVTVSPAAQAYLPFYPTPNAGLIGDGDTGFFNFATPQDSSDNYFTARIDNKFSDKDSIAGTFLIDRGPFTMPDNFDDAVLGYSDNRQVYAFEETHIFSESLVNTVRVGALRQYATANQFISAVNPLVTDTTLGFEPDLTAGQVKISGLAAFSGGVGGYGTTSWGYTTPQLSDDASWVRGTHTIQFGFAGERQDLNFNQTPKGATWSFGSLENFLTNVPSSIIATTALEVPPERGYRDSILGGYVLDDWRWRPYLTLNLGLRYEMLTNPTMVHGYESALTSLTASSPRLGNPFFQANPTSHNFEPRVGFAWDPFHNGKTSVRSGFGLFDSLPMPYEFTHLQNGIVPYTTQDVVSKLPTGTFYNAVLPYLTPSAQTAYFLEQNARRMYVMQWNLSVQRELAPNLTATVSYVGSSGVHLPYDTDYGNGVIPTLTSAGWLYPAPIGSGTVNNPNFGQIIAQTFISHSSYDAMEVLIRKDMSHGFQIQGSYTWGKSIDNDSSSDFFSDFGNSIGFLPLLFNSSLYRGPSDFNVSQTLVVNALWQLPEAKSLPRFAGRAVNGWQIGGIYKATGGMPFTPTFGTGGSVPGTLTGGSSGGFPDRLSNSGACHTAINKGNPNDYIDLSCFSLPTAPSMAFWTANCDTTSKLYGTSKTTEPYPVCLNLLGNASRNSLIGPGLSNLDFSVFKNNRIGEKFNVQFRAEFFNILNRVNFGQPGSTDLYGSNGAPSSSAGLLTSTATSAREIQFALKLSW
jgi:hypothetical protein